jgi:hypothetical protein
MVRVVNFPLNGNDVSVARDLAQAAQLTREPTAVGVFSDYPAATPKWAGRGLPGGAERDFRNTMARLFVELDEKERDKFLASVDLSAPDAHSGESRILASVLAGPRDAKRGTGYIDFLLQDLQMPFQEKTQVVETLADNYVIYYFGQAAVPFTLSGTVLNTVEDDQAINMLRIYRDMIRGTQLARRRKLLRLRVNGMVIAGSALSLSLGLGAESEMYLSFSMQVMPKTVTLLPNAEFGVAVLLDDAPRGGVDDEPVEAARVPTAARFTTVTATNVQGGGASTPPATSGDEDEKTMEDAATLALKREAASLAAIEASPPSQADLDLLPFDETSERANELQGFSEAIDNPGG